MYTTSLLKNVFDIATWYQLLYLTPTLSQLFLTFIPPSRLGLHLSTLVASRVQYEPAGVERDEKTRFRAIVQYELDY